MKISDEVVEVAALAVFTQAYERADWAFITYQVKARYLRDARLGLEAAASHLVVQALDEAVDAFPLETIHAPDNALVWLMRRAEDMRRPWNTGAGE